MSGLGFENSPIPAFMRTVDDWRAQQRKSRDDAARIAAEREVADRVARERLRDSGVLKPSDPLFRNLAPVAGSDNGNGQPAAISQSEWDRPRVFRYLNDGGPADALPSECAEYVSDYERSTTLWGKAN